MKKNNIIISNKNLNEIKKKISEDGKEMFHIIADFDRTLTNEFVNGEEVSSVVSILRSENYLTKDYPEKAYALFNKYHPIEISKDISNNEKKKAMDEWWKKHFQLLIKSGLNKKDLESVVKSSKLKLRKGVLEFLDFLFEKNIPLIIMSASGLGDSISMFLKKEGKLYNNIHIISNSYKWNEKGDAIGYKKPIIHVMNKDETIIHNFPVYDFIKNRKNVLLLGDSLGDVGMIEGFDYKNLIKIGFLNSNIEELKEIYSKNYDVLILDDGSINYVNGLLDEMFG